MRLFPIMLFLLLCSLLLVQGKSATSKSGQELLQALKELLDEAGSQPQKKAVTCTESLQTGDEIIGVLKSPQEGWFKHYSPDKDCSWTIKAPENQTVQLTFKTFRLEDTGFFGSCNDYVEIVGSDDSDGKYCGDENPGVIKSKGDTLTVKFHSDGSDEKEGFVAHYIATGSTTDRTHAACAGETQLLTDSSGDIYSPSYPHPYPPRALCSWKIKVPKGKMVKLEFVEFKLEDSPSCSSDHLRLSQTENGLLLDTVCGDVVPDFISTDQGVHIVFQSDKMVQETGFHIHYEMNDLKTSGGVPTDNLACDFQSDLCAWTQDDQERWQVTDHYYNPNATVSAQEGPKVGFPTQSYTGKVEGSYLVYDLLTRGKVGDSAILTSPEISATPPDGICVKFHYFMAIYVQGILKVILQREGLNDKLLMERFHAQGDNWHEALVHISNPYNFKLVIEASRGTTDMEGSIAIDDISIVQCPSDIKHLSNCKMASEEKRKRILGGENAEKGTYPFIVHMRTFTPGGGGRLNQCGGSLIAPDWIITAAHCFELGENKLVLDPKHLQFHLGEHDVSFANDLWDSTQTVVQAEQIFVHPLRTADQSGEVGPNDIALVKLTHPVMLTEYINLACLPEPEDEFSSGTDCKLAGWGHNPANPNVPELKHLDLTTITNFECKIRMLTLGIDDTMLCAVKRFHKASACQGDSGGPLICQNRAGDYKLAGVVSWGTLCDKAFMPFPSVFARVTHFMPWIKQVMENN